MMMWNHGFNGRAGMALLLLFAASLAAAALPDALEEAFISPPDSARPWVYWFFMDGNLTREGITADLEAMKAAGIGGAIYMEVDVGVEPGPVEFMGPEWQEMLGHAFAEADRLGLEIALAAGPGWCGTGGPWVRPEQSMQHLVASETAFTGPGRFDAVLPQPKPRTPYFGEGTLTPELRKLWEGFYEDVAVLAFPTPAEGARIADADEKALYRRDPYSSMPGVKPFLTAPADPGAAPADQCVPRDGVVDLTAMLAKDGRLTWDAPEGAWTILRFGRTITGQTTRPAPLPGLGLESDKFDPAALDAHFAAYIETLLDHAGAPKNPGRGLTALHFDSWEMGSQNWSGDFAAAFEKSRGYSPLRFLPALTGRVVDSVEATERFLWDLRQAAQELVIENHVGRLRGLAAKRGLAFSSEPYDLNPCSNMEMGAVADVPMCEFWSKGFGFSTEFSCIEAASTAHTTGKAVVAAEAFTAAPGEDWRQHPASMKAQGDWALCAGINRFAFHRYQAQPWLDRFPGMTMGPYGVHWERTQTWWDMAGAYHQYLARCQHLLRRGLFVADILYLAPEGAPHVFRPPSSAMTGDLPDRRGYNFDGCAPGVFLERAAVEDGRILFPDGMSYRLLVLPRFDTMTPRLLRKIVEMVENGATVIGAPPRKSPSLAGYPQCDAEVKELAERLWGGGEPVSERAAGKGKVILDAAAFQPFEEKPLAGARWVWHAEGSPAVAAPAGKRFFRHAFEIESGAVVQSARAFMTADNSFELFVNGRSAGTGDNFNAIQVMEVGALLRPGENSLEVAAGNGDDKPNPAGLIGALHLAFADGSARVIATNGEWTSARKKDGPRTPVMDLGPHDMAPWNLKGLAPWQRELYPDYDTTARILSGMGVPPDFSSGVPLRYIHRRDGGTDLYFVANPNEHPLEVECHFRVTGRQPEWWDPMTGDRRDLPKFFPDADGRTGLLLTLEPLQSGFVVFRKPAGTPQEDVRNFQRPKAETSLDGPWTVSFDPKWGGPKKVIFEKLEDWSQRPEPGIRNYSGKAVYRTVFDGPADTAEGPAFLSLGNVKNMASVRLNGTDLGVAWCAPWRLEIPEGLLRPQGNELEITVANLWINRLIGDSALPERKRLTWSTYTPFRPDAPLEPSGLLGPVALMQEKAAQ